ncbi:MAG: hypothetical protein AAFY34_01965 [Pseudomonadota bacterium]
MTPTAIGLNDQLSAWCSSYIDAFEAFDVSAIGAHWAFPAMIASGDRQIVFKDVESFNRNTATLVGFYKEQDVARVDRVVTGVLQMTEKTAAMQVQDRMFTSSGSMIVEWVSAYVLRSGTQGWRAVFADANGEVSAWAERGTPLGS